VLGFGANAERLVRGAPLASLDVEQLRLASEALDSIATRIYGRKDSRRHFVKSVMKSSLLLIFLVTLAAHADELLPTLMTTRGMLLFEQNFEKPLPPFDGKSNGFASGFKAWRYNAVERGGKWEVKDGCFTGRENPAVHHPATASYGFEFKDVIVQCEVRMNNVPLEGRSARYINVRTTDTKDYVCSIILTPAGFRIQKDDNDHAGPDKAVPLGEKKRPMKLNEWHTVLFEIKGNEMVGSVDGMSLTGTHPLIASDKHSVMFVMGVEGSVRNLKAWEALPNNDWATNRLKLRSEQTRSVAP